MNPTCDSTILDVGVTPDNERPESNLLEKKYPYKDKVTAASIDDASNLEEIYNGLKFVLLDREPLPFCDNQFDIAFSNAVVEHVGSRDNQRKFVEEIVRVSKSCFIVVPDRMFPIEHHTALPFIHYLPQRLHRKLLRLMGKTLYASEETLNLLTKDVLISLFPDNVNIKIMRTKILGFPSNLIAIVNKEGI